MKKEEWYQYGNSAKIVTPEKWETIKGYYRANYDKDTNTGYKRVYVFDADEYDNYKTSYHEMEKLKAENELLKKGNLGYHQEQNNWYKQCKKILEENEKLKQEGENSNKIITSVLAREEKLEQENEKLKQESMEGALGMHAELLKFRIKNKELKEELETLREQYREVAADRDHWQESFYRSNPQPQQSNNQLTPEEIEKVRRLLMTNSFIGG